MLKDSLYFEDTDREAIARAVTRPAEDAIVVTHGTATMGVTAPYLQGCTRAKTVVLTGVMRPFSLFTSDGEFNLGGVWSPRTRRRAYAGSPRIDRLFLRGVRFLAGFALGEAVGCVAVPQSCDAHRG